MATPAFDTLPPVPTLSVIDSLYQSRETLLYDTFPIFRSTFGPEGTPSASPHTLKHLVTTNVCVGPHFFPETRIFLCDWSAPAAPINPSAITPALIARLNAASQTDPALATILQKAATGQATPDELGGLAQYIASIREEDESSAPAAPADPNAPSHPSVVLQFRESPPGEQFVLPTHFLFTPLPSPNPAYPLHDALLSFFLIPAERPPSSYNGKQRAAYGQHGVDPHAPVPVDMVVQQCDERARDALFRAARNGRKKDEQVEDWWRQMITSVPQRTHVLFVPPSVVKQQQQRERTPSEIPGSAALSRTASQLALASAGGAGTPIGSSVGGKRGGTPKEAPGAAKKQKTAPVKAGARKGSRPSAARSSKPATDSPGASSHIGSPAPGSSSFVGADSPALGSPAPSEGSSKAGAKKRAPPTRRGSTRKGKGRAKYNEDDDDDEFGDVKVEGA
ncbi:hypothetical protein Rhopal_002732-T1 [Rhodotorula paludigena]|uniref:Mediator complex subunit 6 n=1 Tax=Rhodotorula paludigena TaxID=86838 RepID=A0AAV5GHY4_9BASI|nr:hypothetical protein Rhopal_002732-T1 [Rhodotorula paludigena]